MSFVYEQEMMEDCALGCSGGGGGGNVTASCWQLYEDYSYHYRREKHWDRSRYERFIKTVKFLYQHNNNNKSTSSTTRRRSYHVGLNKFADNLPVFYDWEEEWNQPWKDKAFFEPTNHNTTVRKRRLPKHILQKSSQDETTPLPSLLTPLVTAKSIVEHSHHHHHHHHRQDYPDKHRSLLDSFKMYVPKPSHHYEQPDNEPPQQELVLPKHMTGKAFEVAALPRNADGLELDLRTPKRHPRKDSFETSLNWATSNNPDGIPLVHDVFDQVG